MRKIIVLLATVLVGSLLLSSCTADRPVGSSGEAPSADTALSVDVVGPTTTNTTTSAKTAVATNSSSVAITTKPSTTKTTGEKRVTYGPMVTEFADIAMYREKLCTLNSKETLQQVFPNANAQQFSEAEFPMLLKDRFFLLPVLPKGSSIKEICFSSKGWTSFEIEFSSGKPVSLMVYHNDERIETENVTEIKNNRGLTLTKKYDSWDSKEDIRVMYKWYEEGYCCRILAKKEHEEEAESFTKALTFEKVTIK